MAGGRLSLTPRSRYGQLPRMARPSSLPLSGPEIVRVASRADVSTKTVRRFLTGVSTLGSTLRRINAALEAEGRGDLARGKGGGLSGKAA